jgi:hypothetical protein
VASGGPLELGFLAGDVVQVSVWIIVGVVLAVAVQKAGEATHANPTCFASLTVMSGRRATNPIGNGRDWTWTKWRG